MTSPARALALIFTVAALASCTGWQITGTSPRALDSLPSHVRVTLVSGERIEFKSARLEGDSLTGVRLPDTTVRPVRMSVAEADIRRVAVRGSTANTRAVRFTGGVAVITAVLGLFLVPRVY